MTLYDAIKEMVVTYQFRPNERINEVHLAKRLSTSRTPVREVLNRLHAEGLLQFKKGSGFSCRQFNPREIQELYQLRGIIETAAIRLACEQATNAEVAALRDFLHKTGPEPGDRSSEELVALDQYFHEQIMLLSRNHEMLQVLCNINARIRFFRWVDMADQRHNTQSEHLSIVDALEQRDADAAVELMNNHIHRRLDQITRAVKVGHDLLGEMKQQKNAVEDAAENVEEQD